MTPQERLKIFNQERQGRTAEERRRIFLEEQAARRQPPRERGALDALGGGLAQAGGDLVSSALSVYEAGKSAIGGDFTPARELAESAGRGALKFASAFDPAGNAYAPVAAEQDPRLAELQQRRTEREGRTSAGQFVQRRNAQLAAEAEQDKSAVNRLARGAGRLVGAAAPAVVSGVLTGGSVPAMAATSAIQSAGQPEAIVPSTLIGAAPIPVGQAFKAGVNAVRRAFGKGAAQIIEAEALPAATAQVRQSIGEAAPVVREAVPPTGQVNSPVQNAIRQFEEAVQRINASNLPPNLKAAEMRAAIAQIGREARGVPPSAPGESMVQSRFPRAMQAGPMRMPDEPLGAVTGFTEPPTAPGITPETAIPATATPAPADQYGIMAAFSNLNLGEGFRKALRDSVTKTGKLPRAEKGSSIDRAYETAVAQGAPRNVDTLERVLQGETGPPRLEADLGAQQFNVRAAPDAPFSESTGPSMSEALGMNVGGASASVAGPSAGANMGLNAAVAQAAQSVPKPIAGRILNELAAIYHLPKSLLSSLDISAPFRQGSLLTIPPSQWGRVGRAGVRMFQAFSTKQFDRIKQEIAGHVDGAVADDAGLYLVTKAGQTLQGAEEAFLSKYAGKIPLVKQSQQAYETYLDSLRMDTFAKYKRVIDGQGLAPEQAQSAYKAAATWINYATGRGSLGQKIDKAMPALNAVFFSPRYLASRLNVLNPAYYARNAATAEGRTVLKQQMGELAQYAGMVAATMKLAQAAGADVSLNPNDSDFLKIRAGNWRYDALAGLQQVMRLYFRAGADINRRVRGEKSQGPNALEIGGSFLRSKLAPPPTAFVDFVKGRTVTGKPFSAGKAAVDMVAPIQWADFVEAYQKEGWGGVGMATPGLVGIGANLQEPRPVDAAIQKSQPLFSELQRLNKRITDLRKKDGEQEEVFQGRVKQFSQNYTQFGLRLLNNPRFQAAPDNVKGLALDRLNERAKSMTSREFAFPELELDANTLMDSAESSKKNAGKR